MSSTTTRAARAGPTARILLRSYFVLRNLYLRFGKAAEFVVVTGFNALTLGAALLFFGRVCGIESALVTIVAAHGTSATLSYVFCSRWVWSQPNDSLRQRVLRALAFFGLAAVTAVASLAVTAALESETKSLLFVALNYGAAGAITVVKFGVQRWAMTSSRVAAPSHGVARRRPRHGSGSARPSRG